MTGVVFYLPNARQLSNAGAILPGWKLRFYKTDSTILAGIYANGDLSTPLDNPVVADTDGMMPVIYLNPLQVYRVQLFTASDVMIDDVDPFDVSRGTGGGGGAPVDATYLTVADESGTLTSSRQLLAGSNVTFDDSVAGERTVSAAFSGEDEQDTGLFDFLRYSVGNAGMVNADAGAMSFGFVSGGGLVAQTRSPATSLIASMFRMRATSSSATNSNAGLQPGGTNEGIYREVSSSSIGGGFIANALFSIPTAGYKAAQSAILGLTPDVSQPSFASGIAAMTNIVGIGKDDADLNIFVIHNDGAGSATKVDTGLAWTDVLDKAISLTVSCPASGTPVTVRLHVLDDSFDESYDLASNIPAADTPLYRKYLVNTGSANNTAVSIDIVRAYMRWNEVGH